MRNLDNSTRVELLSSVVYPGIFCEVEFESGFYRLWTGIGDKTWDGKTWAGVGDLGRIAEITETQDLRAVGVTVELAGIDSSLIGSIIGDARQGKSAAIYLATMDAEWNIIGTPYGAFVGLVDVPVIEEDGATATIRINLESRLIELERPRLRRWTDEDQKQDHPTDDGFEYVGTLAKLGSIYFQGSKIQYGLQRGQWHTPPYSEAV